MNTDVGIIVGTLTKKFELCRNFLNSFYSTHPLFPKDNIIVIDDTGIGSEISTSGDLSKITWIPAMYPWAYSKNANLLIRAALQMRMDLFLCNDDTEFRTINTVYELQTVCKMNKDIGVLSPLFLGGVGNPSQMAVRGTFETRPEPFIQPNTLCFVAVYLPYSTMKEVGYLNEAFSHESYGFEDNEYCDRVLEKKKHLAITRRALMRHGTKGTYASSTYKTLPNLDLMVAKGRELYKQETARRKRFGID